MVLIVTPPAPPPPAPVVLFSSRCRRRAHVIMLVVVMPSRHAVCVVIVTSTQLLWPILAHPPPVHCGRRAGWRRVVTWHGGDLHVAVVRAPCFHGVVQRSGRPCRLGCEVGGLVDCRGVVSPAVKAVVMAWQHEVSMNSDTKKKKAH